MNGISKKLYGYPTPRSYNPGESRQAYANRKLADLRDSGYRLGYDLGHTLTFEAILGYFRWAGEEYDRGERV